jgi:hypothetical protein
MKNGLYFPEPTALEAEISELLKQAFLEDKRKLIMHLPLRAKAEVCALNAKSSLLQRRDLEEEVKATIFHYNSVREYAAAQLAVCLINTKDPQARQALQASHNDFLYKTELSFKEFNASLKDHSHFVKLLNKENRLIKEQLNNAINADNNPSIEGETSEEGTIFRNYGAVEATLGIHRTPEGIALRNLEARCEEKAFSEARALYADRSIQLDAVFSQVLTSMKTLRSVVRMSHEDLDLPRLGSMPCPVYVLPQTLNSAKQLLSEYYAFDNKDVDDSDSDIDDSDIIDPSTLNTYYDKRQSSEVTSTAPDPQKVTSAAP